MKVLCLDTSAYSRFMRGGESLTALLEEADRLLVPVTVLGELHAGFEMGKRLKQNLEELKAFLRTPGTTVLPATDNVAERYGKLVKQLREQGTPIPTNDIWIAAAALETGARLVAYDSHYDHIPGLIIESPG